MKKKKQISSDEIVSVFLKGEIASPRWKARITQLLNRYNISTELLNAPNVLDGQENQIRKQILGDFRGFERNKDLFESFPDHVQWWRVLLTKEELLLVKYMHYDYWDLLSQGTRLPLYAAETIRNGVEIFGQSNRPFLELAQRYRAGSAFPEVILVATKETSTYVLLEGHVRLTAMAVANEYIPDQVEVIVGYSEDIIRWGSY